MTRSEDLFAQTLRVIPGGVNSPVRAFGAVGGVPRFMERGQGPFLWDVDGNRVIDYVMSWGPLIHGHAFGPVVEAASAALAHGTTFGTPTEAEVRLAEMVVEAVPSVEMVRFVSSGTEAVMSSIRLARAFTGRDLVVKFAGNYHGHSDSLLVDAGSGSLTLNVPSSPGVPASSTSTTIVAPYNGFNEIRDIFKRKGDEIAAVIVEPVAGNMGVVSPSPGFLETLRELTADAGSLLIFDEVITGFRVGRGGVQATAGIQPDLTTLGKILGGGLPVGAYGGRRDVMEMVAPAGPVYQAGTLSGNPVAMAAGAASLEPLALPCFYGDLQRKTEYLRTGLEQAARDARVNAHVSSATGMLTLFFTNERVVNLEGAKRADTAKFGAFFRSMLQKGVFIPPSQFEAWMVSAAHDEAVLDQTISVARDALKEIGDYPA